MMIDQPSGEAVPIDPEQLTPASRRAYRNITAVYVITILSIAAAFGFYVQGTTRRIDCRTWDRAHAIIIGVTTHLPEADGNGNPLSAHDLGLRRQGNAAKDASRARMLAGLKGRPKC